MDGKQDQTKVFKTFPLYVRYIYVNTINYHTCRQKCKFHFTWPFVIKKFEELSPHTNMNS